ncbi:ParB/RepB/Spo0J family partition protein [Aureimonas sp. AU40]|uniref:ParB/RepB/Spo0J family partition protein n=1 Tax=Aureimonas sp. AU40 TaxID=1637747 RepID=UPI0009E6CA2C|nr:ParB/RepB/Spo0J family partition protein [Aureimonas sp. AU40]
MTKPQFLELPVGDLAPNPWNSNFLTPDAEARLDESLKRFGTFKPIVVREFNGGYEILGGKHRWESAGRIGLATVPVMNLGPLDDKRAKEISLVDNYRFGTDDAQALAELVKSIGEEEIQIYLPIDEDDLSIIMSTAHIAVDDLDIDENFDKDVDPQSESDDDEKPERVPKTHTHMRFKLTLADAETLTRIIADTKRAQGFTEEDDLTNAGDALMHLLVSGHKQTVTSSAPRPEPQTEEDVEAALARLDDIDDGDL